MTKLDIANYFNKKEIALNAKLVHREKYKGYEIKIEEVNQNDGKFQAYIDDKKSWLTQTLDKAKENAKYDIDTWTGVYPFKR